MTSDQLTAEQKAQGGLGPDFFATGSWGYCVRVEADGRFGWDGGLGTSWLVDPARDLTVIVLTQRMFDSPTTPQVHRDIQAAAYAAIAEESESRCSAREPTKCWSYDRTASCATSTSRRPTAGADLHLRVHLLRRLRRAGPA